jgi:hypothetical protein
VGFAVTGDFDTVGGRPAIEDDPAYPPHPDAISAFDFSSRSIPSEWMAAERESPTATDRPVFEPSTRFSPPDLHPRQAGAAWTQAFLGGLLGAIIGGIGWYAVHVFGWTTGPWPAVVLGVLIGGLAGWERSVPPSFRVATTGALYSVAVLVVFTALTLHGLFSIYGEVAGFAEFETMFFNTHLRTATDGLATIGGAVAGLAVAGLVRRPR